MRNGKSMFDFDPCSILTPTGYLILTQELIELFNILKNLNIYWERFSDKAVRSINQTVQVICVEH